MSDVWECNECRGVVSPQARVCPHCGHRAGMGGLTKGIIVFILLAVIIAIGSVAENAPSTLAGTHPKTPIQTEDEKYGVAVFACEMWAGKNAPGITHTDIFGVPDGVIGTYTLPRRKKDSRNLYRAGFRYRSAGIGLLMRADCAIENDGQHLAVREAAARAY